MNQTNYWLWIWFEQGDSGEMRNGRICSFVGEARFGGWCGVKCKVGVVNVIYVCIHVTQPLEHFRLWESNGNKIIKEKELIDIIL